MARDDSGLRFPQFLYGILISFAKNASTHAGRLGVIACFFGALFACAVFLHAAIAARAAEPVCEALAYQDHSFTVCSFDARSASIRLFLRSSAGDLYGGFARLADDLARRGEQLTFAMNAGMYDSASEPVGLYVEEGRELHPANTRSGEGNFHLKPNGIFWIGKGIAAVTETGRFLARRPQALFATQSGPMLVIGGRLHPKIHAEGTSRKIRNGVGIAGGRIVRFAISNDPVTFYEFASFFRDRLGCPDALFLDGSVSSLYAPGLGREDRFRPMGPIVGVVEPAR